MMYCLVFVSLFFVTVDSCGGGGKGGKNGALQHFMGAGITDSGQVSSDRYEASNGGADSFSDLSCSSSDTSNCCWRQHPDSEIDWIVAAGQADPSRIRQHFGNKDPPSGPGFLAAYQNKKAARDKLAVMESCAIPCATGSVDVSLTSWQSSVTHLEVCTIRADSTDVEDHQDCQDIPEGSTSVTVPAMDEPFRILLIASDFTDSRGSVVAMDDLYVSGQMCDDVTDGPTDGPTTGVCSALACSFDSRDKCSYREASGAQWEVSEGRIGNPSTGVRRAAPGSEPYYAGVNLAPGETATLKSGRFSGGSPRELKFKKYEATYDVELKACVNGESDCPWRSDTKVTTADREWSEHSIPLDSNAEEVVFVATNSGSNYGAAGLDDIRVFSQSGREEC